MGGIITEEWKIEDKSEGIGTPPKSSAAFARVMRVSQRGVWLF